jgi:Flp pilus assembly protein TadG
MLILLPLFVGILQLGIALYVRNTLAACAQEGARYGANEDFEVEGPDVEAAQAVDRTVSCINASLSTEFSGGVTATAGPTTTAGLQVDVVEVKVGSPVPVIGLFGLGNEVVHVKGDAMQEKP